LKKSITAVIPCYNSESTIQQAVESVLNQSSPVNEIIVLDDHSLDQTVLILKELQKNHPQIQIITHDQNQGPSRLRNLGIQLAKSKYVAFLDADDYWHPDKIKIFSDDAEVAFWASKYSTAPSKNQIVSGTKKISFAQQILRNHVATPTAIINKEIIHERFDETMKYCEDYEYFTRLTYHYGLYLNQSILCITSKQKGLSRHLFKMRLGEIRMYFKAVKYCKPLLFWLPFLILYSLIKHLLRAATASPN